MKKAWPYALAVGLFVTSVNLLTVGCNGDDPGPTPPPAPIPTNAPAPTVSTLVSDLQGDWTLESFGIFEAETAVVIGSIVTVTFDATGNVSGNAGCNNYSGTYTADNAGNISVGSLISTMMMCSPSIMTQEGDYRGALQGSLSFEIVGSTLHISYGVGQRMIFN